MEIGLFSYAPVIPEAKNRNILSMQRIAPSQQEHLLKYIHERMLDVNSV
jgi:hypothetical protein